MPLTIVIDDLPVHTKWVEPEAGRRSSRMVFSVLLVAEVRWHLRDDSIEREHKLRLIRASPTNEHLAWKLVLHELGYVPDFIISDSDDSQMKANRELYAGEAEPPVVIPSMFHIRFGLEEVLKETPGAFHQQSPRGTRELRAELADHLALLSRRHLTTMTPVEWSRWWDDLERHLATLGAPVEATRVRRERYEQMVADVLPTIAKFPQLPLSTGGVEVAIRRKVAPLLENRGSMFANIERTNRLFDLVVCDDHGLFDEVNVAELLRRDSEAHDGWGSPLRSVTDAQPPNATARKGRYSSLRDQLLLREVARAKGLR